MINRILHQSLITHSKSKQADQQYQYISELISLLSVDIQLNNCIQCTLNNSV